jgi:hypothetical protein
MEITQEMIHWLGGALVAALSIVVAAIGMLLRVAMKVGANAEKFATGLTMLTDLKKAVDKIPIIEKEIGTLQDAWKNTRSDIKELRRERRGSQPAWDGEGSAEE